MSVRDLRLAVAVLLQLYVHQVVIRFGQAVADLVDMLLVRVLIILILVFLILVRVLRAKVQSGGLIVDVALEDRRGVLLRTATRCRWLVARLVIERPVHTEVRVIQR